MVGLRLKEEVDGWNLDTVRVEKEKRELAG